MANLTKKEKDEPLQMEDAFANAPVSKDDILMNVLAQMK